MDDLKSNSTSEEKDKQLLPLEVEKRFVEKQKVEENVVKRREAYERRSKLKQLSEDSKSESSENRYDMGANKKQEKKSKSRLQMMNSINSVERRGK